MLQLISSFTWHRNHSIANVSVILPPQALASVDFIPESIISLVVGNGNILILLILVHLIVFSQEKNFL